MLLRASRDASPTRSKNISSNSNRSSSNDDDAMKPHQTYHPNGRDLNPNRDPNRNSNTFVVKLLIFFCLLAVWQMWIISSAYLSEHTKTYQGMIYDQDHQILYPTPIQIPILSPENPEAEPVSIAIESGPSASDTASAIAIAFADADTGTGNTKKNPTGSTKPIGSSPSKSASNTTRNSTSASTAGAREATGGTVLIAPNQPQLLIEQQIALWNATKTEFDRSKPWKNASTFTTVGMDAYQQLVEKAHASVGALVEDVYTGCELFILPALQADDGDNNPRIWFKCLTDDDPVLRDDLCHTVNLCRVVMDEKAWKEETSLVYSNTSNDRNTFNSSDNDDNNKNNAKKSVLLMIVDSIKYMKGADIFNATINKASYAYRSNRPFYIWIGNLNQTELNRRESDSIEPAFGADCATKHLENTMHYYKPIAFLVLLDVIRSSPSPSSESIFLLDADTAFTPIAFDRIDNEKFNVFSNGDDTLGPIGPESYLDLSPQASLVGTQNIGGAMLMNSGLIVLRNTQWSRDFNALWWYCRCGEKDQLALWLVMYATFSAWTMMAANEPSVGTGNELSVAGPTQFAYPGKIFFQYDAALNKVFMHFRGYGRNLQRAWEAVVERRRKEQRENGLETNDRDNYEYPIPTNTKLYNGGEKIKRKFDVPMELPHVVILPQNSFSFHKTIKGIAEDGASSTLRVDLPRLKSDDENAFITHSKSLQSSCSDGRCWPYVKE